ncbi:MAG: nucleotide exchange factor GrpE [Desulfamplus sp.]|nr:nucleotide exchange factor GrpE [Desulfamplus sp.]
MEQKESQEILTSNDVPPNTADTIQDTSINSEDIPSAQSFEESELSGDNQSADNNTFKESAPTVEQLQAALAAEKDRVLRVSAEFDNYKKRSSREIADFRKFANESVFKQLLTVVDNLERALSSASSQNSAVIQGVEMTYKDIIKLFEAFNVRPVDAQGKPFDPAFHQAVSHQESEQYPDNMVIAELQKGYILHERLLRPSMVVVSKSATTNNTAVDKE